jgi:hypothetical protein
VRLESSGNRGTVPIYFWEVSACKAGRAVVRCAGIGNTVNVVIGVRSRNSTPMRSETSATSDGEHPVIASRSQARSGLAEHERAGMRNFRNIARRLSPMNDLFALGPLGNTIPLLERRLPISIRRLNFRVCWVRNTIRRLKIWLGWLPVTNED